jgi:hypothetical protein
MDINDDFYIPILSGLAIQDLTGTGYLSSVANPEKPQAVTVKGKRLVLALKEVLRAGKKDDQIIFHPMSENVTRAESDVIKALRDFIQWRNQTVGVLLITELGRVASTPSEHKNYPAKAKKYLQQVTDFDEGNYVTLLKLLKTVKPDPDRRILSLTLRQGSKTKDDGVVRSCLVHFPIFEDFEKDDLTVFDTKMPSKKAKARIAKLFEIVFGDEETRKSFSYGSRNMDAPYLHSLLTVHARLAEHFNALVATHAKILGEELTAMLTTPLDWVPLLEEFSTMRNLIPPQSGNEGAIRVDAHAKDKEKASTLKKEVTRELLAPPVDREPEPERSLPWEGERDDTPAVRRDRGGREEREPVRAERSVEKKGMTMAEYLAAERGGDRDDDRRGGSILRSNRDTGRDSGRSSGRGGLGGRSGGRRSF